MKFILTAAIVAVAALSAAHPDDGASHRSPEGKTAKVAPSLRLSRVERPQQDGKAQQVSFIGDGGGPIHRGGPEHFLLTRVADAKRVALEVAYERADLEPEPRGEERVRLKRPARAHYSYGYQFKGVALDIISGDYDAKDSPEAKGRLTLHGRAELEPGVKYRLTWACWPVGAKAAVEVSCDFEVGQ